jgi:hypothetical protein
MSMLDSFDRNINFQPQLTRITDSRPVYLNSRALSKATTFVLCLFRLEQPAAAALVVAELGELRSDRRQDPGLERPGAEELGLLTPLGSALAAAGPAAGSTWRSWPPPWSLRRNP